MDRQTIHHLLFFSIIFSCQQSTLHCHGQDGGAQCINTRPSAAPSGTFNLERNRRSAPPESSLNLKSRRANTRGDTCIDTDPTSAEDIANESSDFPDLDTEDDEVLEEEGVTGEEVEEEEEESNEEDGNEEGNEEDEPVSNDDMEHSVIVVASGRPKSILTSRRHPIVVITMMYRLFIIFH